jgi:hypothetical protein
VSQIKKLIFKLCICKIIFIATASAAFVKTFFELFLFRFISFDLIHFSITLLIVSALSMSSMFFRPFGLIYAFA